MFSFRKYTRVHLMLILSLQSLLQNQSLETIQVCIVVLCFPHNNIASIQICDECTRSNAPNVGHQLLSISLPHEQVSSQTIKYQVSQYEPNTDISEQFVSKLTNFLLLSIDGHPCMVLRLCVIVESFYSQIRIIFPHNSLHDLPCHWTKKILFLHQVSLKL